MHVRKMSCSVSVVKVAGDQIHLVRMISKVGEDASHGSRRVVGCTYV